LSQVLQFTDNIINLHHFRNRIFQAITCTVVGKGKSKGTHTQ